MISVSKKAVEKLEKEMGPDEGRGLRIFIKGIG